MGPPNDARPKLLISAAFVALTLFAGERAAQRLVQDSITVARPPNLRAPNVHVLKDGARPDAKPERPAVILVGNSHTYALPSLVKGHALLLDPGVTLIDQLERHVAATGTTAADYYRLSYPNFLPLEMLLRTSELLANGLTPRVLVLGLTYRNIVRDSEPRHSIRATLRDATFRAALTAMLREASAEPSVLAAIQREQERVDRDAREAQMRSAADRLDEALVDRLEEELTLVGKSNDMRALIYRALTVDIQQSFTNAQQTYLYDVVENDYALNVACLGAYLRLLRARGVSVLVYLAPERSDLPPLVDPAGQEKFNAALRAMLSELGYPLVDARGVVPNEHWGWMLDSPDRSHFTEKGHELLGQFLAEEGAKAGVWAPLVKR
ncbi:SGNH/GDSL hydrolase family protein [Myxococcota bacterium]|nr:SGNH/GDSL hydrolase family protein [Myxococcota bacterium]